MDYPISLVTIVNNAEVNLEKLIEKHRPFVKEIVVVDQGSTDKTFEVAKRLADVVTKRRKKGYVEPDRNYAVSLCSQPYVLMLDDDEELSQDLIDAIPELIKSNADIFWFKRTNLVDGHDIEPLLGLDYQCRLWKHGAVRWSDVMHKFPEGADNAKVFFVDKPIIHTRSFAGMKKANLSRNKVANPEHVEMQTRFINAVEALLVKNGVINA